MLPAPGTYVVIDDTPAMNQGRRRDCIALRGGVLYVIAAQRGSPTHEWRAYSSSDYGANWIELDAANRPQFVNGSASISGGGSGTAISPTLLGTDSILYGDNFWCCCLSHVDDENVALLVFRFDMATEQWSEPPAGPTGQHISETFGDTSLFALWNTHRHLVATRRGDDIVLMRNFLFDDGGTFNIYPTVSVFSTTSETWTASLVKAVGSADTLAFSANMTVDARTNGDILIPVIEYDAAVTHISGGPTGALKLGVLNSSNTLSAGAVIQVRVGQANDNNRLRTGFYQPFPLTTVVDASADSPYDVSMWVNQQGQPRGALYYRSADAGASGWRHYPVTSEQYAATPTRKPEPEFLLYGGGEPQGLPLGSSLSGQMRIALRNGDIFETDVVFQSRATNTAAFGDIIVGPRIPGGYAVIGNKDDLFFEKLAADFGASEVFFV